MANMFDPPTKEELAATQNFGVMDYAKDWGRSALGGPRRGLESIPGTGGDVYNALSTFASILARATPEEQDKMYQELSAQGWQPSSAETEAATEPYLGKHYEPQTRVGRILNLIGATIAGGGGRHIVRDFLAPAVGGEVGGEIGEKFGGKGGALIGTLTGAGTGGSMQEGLKRQIFRPATPERIENINILQGERTLPDAQGNTRPDPIELTGGQATGSQALQYAEAGPFEGKAQGIARQQAQQYTRAVMRRAGIESDRADAATLSREQDNFSNEYDAMIQQNNGIIMDGQLMNELEAHGVRYEDLKGSSKDAVGKYFNRIIDAADQHGGVIPPDVFQQINGEISDVLKSARNSPELSALSNTLREFRDSMYASMERNGQVSGIADRARDLNNRYRNFKIIEKAMRGQGQDTMYGFVTPGNLATAVKQSESITDWAQSRGEFDDLAKAGGMTAPIKSSGTAGRSLVGAIIPGIATGVGLMLNDQPMAGMGTIGGSIAAPFLASAPGQVLTSRPVRTSIVNRARGINPTETVGVPGTRFNLESDSMFTPLPIQGLTAPNWEYGSRGGVGPEMPVPVEEQDPVTAPAGANSAVPSPADMPVPVNPPAPGQQGALPPEVLPRLAELLGGRRLPMRV